MAYEQSSRRNTLVLLLLGAVAIGSAMIWLMVERIRFDDTPRIQEIGVISPEHSEETHASVIAKGAPEPEPIGETPTAQAAPEGAPAPEEVDVANTSAERTVAREVTLPAEKPEVVQTDETLIAPIDASNSAEQVVAAAKSAQTVAEAPRTALNDPFGSIGTNIVEPKAPATEAHSGFTVAGATLPETGLANPNGDLSGNTSAADDQPQVNAATQSVSVDVSGPISPSFDLVRLEADGSGVIAGRAAPGAVVQIIGGGAELAEVTANANGEFVAILGPRAAQGAQSIELISNVEGGPLARSDDSIIVLERIVESIKGPADPAAAAQGETANVQTAALTQDAAQDEQPTAPLSAAPVIANTTEGIRVVQPVMIAPDQVSLDTISYDEAGEVIISGRAQPGGEVWLYVDQNRAAEVPVSDTGTWRTTLEGINEGRYLLRADEISPDGDVASRAESPFQRQVPSQENLALLTSEKEVIVQPGANLWNIAKLRYGEGIKYWVIFDANEGQIRDPDLIYPGQIFALPEAE